MISCFTIYLLPRVNKRLIRGYTLVLKLIYLVVFLKWVYVASN